MPGVGMRVEVDHRDPAEPVVPSDTRGVRQGDRMIAAEYEWHRACGTDGVHRRLDVTDAALDVAGEALDVAAVVDPQVSEPVGPQRKRGSRTVLCDVAGLSHGAGAEPGARPVRGATVERRANDHHVRVGEGRGVG